MNKTLGIIVVLVILAGGYWWWMSSQSAAPAPASATGPTPDQMAGTNGSPNQGNLGQPDNGQVQQPLADGAEGSVIGDNLALGVNNNAKFGRFLSGYTGQTVYTYSKDTGSVSTCYDQCATNWPPYVVGPEDNLTHLQAGVIGTVGTSKRTDGSLQVTYNGHPLYFYAGDKTSADTNGQGIGSVWYVVKP